MAGDRSNQEQRADSFPPRLADRQSEPLPPELAADHLAVAARLAQLAPDGEGAPPASTPIPSPRNDQAAPPGRRIPVLGWFLRAFDALDEQAAHERSLPGYDAAAEAGRVRQILLVAAILLVLGYSFGDRPFFTDTFGEAIARRPRLARYAELMSYVYWSLAKLVGFGLLPLLHLRLLGDRAGDFGLGRRPVAVGSAVPRLPWGRTYALLLLGILPAVVAVSFTPAFQQGYPFYRLSGRSGFDFVVWELSYLATFVAVEFFFRGYLLFGLRRAFGSHALFISMVPYCMIHVLKPAPEALGSIFAGVLLGTLALCTGSLWCGVLLHVTVALTMDLLASLQTHNLPALAHFWP